MDFSMFYGSLFNYIGSVALALVYLSLVMLMCKTPKHAKLKAVFSNVGKMAFTNYIFMTVIAGLIFYGHGLGLIGSVSRVYQVIITLGIWSIILIVSPIWLKHFYYGPLEWLWRSLTYLKAVPFKKKTSEN